MIKKHTEKIPKNSPQKNYQEKKNLQKKSQNNSKITAKKSQNKTKKNLKKKYIPPRMKKKL